MLRNIFFIFVKKLLLLIVALSFLAPYKAFSSNPSVLALNKNEQTQSKLTQYKKIDIASRKINKNLKTAPIKFVVAKDTVSLLFSAVSDNAASYVVDKLVDPNGRSIDMTKFTRTYEPDAATLLYPNDGTTQYLIPGEWHVVFRAMTAVKDDQLQTTIIAKTSTSLKHKAAKIKLVLHFSGSHNITAENFNETYFGREIDELKVLYLKMGIHADIAVGENLDKKFQYVATFINKDISFTGELLNSVPADTDTIQIFVVDQIFTEMTAAQGISFGAPSRWKSNSIIISSRPFDHLAPEVRIRELIIHELGHLFGLYHTVESDGVVNHLAETIAMRNNYMLPRRLEHLSDYELTPSQIAIINNHPLVDWYKE